MNEQNTYKGFWWLSDTPSRRVPGSMSILSNGDVVFESIGELEDNDFCHHLLIIHSFRLFGVLIQMIHR